MIVFLLNVYLVILFLLLTIEKATGGNFEQLTPNPTPATPDAARAAVPVVRNRSRSHRTHTPC